jgi:hypothetical protein
LKIKTRLALPDRAISCGFLVEFQIDGTPRPRYLGRSTDRNMAEYLRNSAPPIYFRPSGETQSTKTPSEENLATFKKKMELVNIAQKGKRLAAMEKRAKDQQGWNRSIKRVQKYLGIRGGQFSHDEVIRATLQSSGLKFTSYGEVVKAAAAKLGPSAKLDVNKPVPFHQEDSVIFICIDLEAYERDHSLITEIGIATLDTEDIKSLAPGKGGQNWTGAIHARHFRIKEYMHLRNTKFVQGCADKFEFG